LDSSSNVYIAGQTSSIDFPVLNPAQPARGGNFDGFVAKISSTGTKTYATYLGGSGDDRATGIAVNSAGNAYVTGYTASTNFPTVSPLQGSNGGGTDTFVAKLSVSGNALIYSTYLGGSANEDFTSTTTFTGNIAVDSASNAYLTGYTASNNFPTVSPLQGSNSGGASDVFIAKISDDTTPPIANPLDDAQFFVRQHYLDFLNREPDPDGFAYWTNEITSCGTDTACINGRRISVSASFFIATEFQESGNFVYRLYKGALGRQPNYAEFSLDRSKVVGGPDLEANTTALADDFVLRPEFKQLYPDAMTNAQFVNKLFDTLGLIPFASERQQQIDAMIAGKTRVQVVRDVIEITEFKNREFNPSFVLMEYFGYLRRDPDPDGYDFWLDVITNREPNNYRGMVCSFITSIEYQNRFSSMATHSNSECAGVH
jgi:hypothetical protein